MANFASKVSIISQAFFLLGAPTINTLETSNPLHVGASQRYDSIIPALLSETHWKFAQKTQVLTKTTDTPPIDEWAYTYQLPNKAEMMLAFRIYPLNYTYEIIQDKLYSNASEVTLFYIYEPSEEFFPQYFVNYLTYVMAAECAMAVTQKIEIEQIWRKQALEAKVISASIDAQQSPNKSICYDGLEIAHLSAGGYGGRLK